MQTIKIRKQLHSAVAAWKDQGQSVAFVPTMGNLHQGHLHLVELARQRADRVVVSIFVNPMQFGQNEDIDRYPRTLEQDSAQLAQAGVDVLFAPEVAEVYPVPLEQLTRIEVPGVSEILCGAFRPGHFTGVATVVAKLFNMVQPDLAIFGEKDFQQLHVIRTMVRDLNMPVKIMGVPTVREPDGLAMSSRNAYLSPGERKVAAILYQVLSGVALALQEGGREFDSMEKNAIKSLENAGFRPDYVSIRRISDLRPATAQDRDLVVLAAAWLGMARLIDNITVTLEP